MKRITTYLLLFCAIMTNAQTYLGRVVDQKGNPIPFANIYMKDKPTVGTVSNSRGSFTITPGTDARSTLVISFIGYQTKEFPIGRLSTTDTMRVVMKEQAIELENVVVDRKKGRQSNRKKGIQKVLYLTYNQLEKEFPTQPVRYHVNSDVRAISQGQTAVLERMEAYVVEMPNAIGSDADTVQVLGLKCYRYMNPEVRRKVDYVTSIVTDKKELGRIDRMDHGTRVQTGIWGGNVREEFAALAKSVKGWTISKENDQQTVLTHTKTRNVMGIYKTVETRNFIINSETYSLLRTSSEMQVQIQIPIGYKLKGELLAWINVLNMNNDDYQKFRLKSAVGTIKQNAIYEHEGGRIYTKEKNIRAVGTIKGDNGKVLPVNGSGTIHVLSKQTSGVRPYTKAQLAQPVKRIWMDAE